MCGRTGGALSPDGEAWMSAPQFKRMLVIEQKRCVRSGRRIVLMLLESKTLPSGGGNADLRDKVLRTLARSIRDTDIRGWYEEQSIFGVIFTEVGSAESKAIVNAQLTRVNQVLAGSLGI